MNKFLIPGMHPRVYGIIQGKLLQPKRTVKPVPLVDFIRTTGLHFEIKPDFSILMIPKDQFFRPK